jgi:hypothetical protein
MSPFIGNVTIHWECHHSLGMSPFIGNVTIHFSSIYLSFLLLNNSQQQSPSLEAYTGHTQKNGAVLIVNTIKTVPFFCVCPVLSQLVKKFPAFYGTPKVHKRVHNSPLLVDV